MISITRSFLLFAVMSLAVLAGPTTQVIAQDATPAAGELTILAPDESYGGASRGEWDARWWQWAVSLPPASNPSVNFEDADCGAGQFGPVFFMPGNFTPESVEANCVVPAGVAIYVGVGGAECSSVEPPPYFGRDEEELRACAIAMNDSVTALDVSVNGQDLPNILDYRTTSPMFTMNFPEDNIFGGPSGLALSVANGYSFVIAPPPPGEYEIVVSTTFDETDTYTGIIHITVEEPQVIEPQATPEGSPETATPIA